MAPDDSIPPEKSGKSRHWKIIPNRTQTKNPSFELTVRISQDVLIVWVCLTCPEHDIQTSRTVQVSLFPFFPCQLFPFAKRLALECLSVPHHSISWWTDVAARWSRLVRTRFRRLVISIFWNTLMAIFKGLEPQNYAFGGNLWNSINSKFRWSISIVQTATKNL